MNQELKNQALPEFVETNLQNTSKRFRIATNPNKEVRSKNTFNNKKLDYMNFTIELVIGKKVNGMHVQYSLEYIKKACS